MTGNASGSYTFCRSTAKEYLKDNLELIGEVIEEFCIPADTVADNFKSCNWEYWDVSIRCYLLGQAIAEVVEDIEL